MSLTTAPRSTRNDLRGVAGLADGLRPAVMRLARRLRQVRAEPGGEDRADFVRRHLGELMYDLRCRNGHSTLRTMPQLVRALRRAGGRVELEIDGALRVEGLGLPEVGDVAFVADVRLHELSRVTASLEAAYLDLTDDDVEYRAVTP